MIVKKNPQFCHGDWPMLSDHIIKSGTFWICPKGYIFGTEFSKTHLDVLYEIDSKYPGIFPMNAEYFLHWKYEMYRQNLLMLSDRQTALDLLVSQHWIRASVYSNEWAFDVDEINPDALRRIDKFISSFPYNEDAYYIIKEGYIFGMPGKTILVSASQYSEFANINNAYHRSAYSVINEAEKWISEPDYLLVDISKKSVRRPPARGRQRRDHQAVTWEIRDRHNNLLLGYLSRGRIGHDFQWIVSIIGTTDRGNDAIIVVGKFYTKEQAEHWIDRRFEALKKFYMDSQEMKKELT